MENQNFKIICDECGCDIDLRDLETHTRTFEYQSKKYTITAFKCPECGKYYLVEVLDYYAEKLKNKYLRISESINKKSSSGKKVSQERYDELEKAKIEAIEYQRKLMDEIKDNIPEEVFKSTGEVTNTDKMEEN